MTNRQDLRLFFKKYLDNSDVENFCFDHYSEVFAQISPTMMKDRKVLHLLDHVEKRNGFNELLTYLKADFPKRYRLHFTSASINDDINFIVGVEPEKKHELNIESHLESVDVARPPSSLVDSKYSSNYYYWGNSFARAFRLVGAQDEFFPINRIKVDIESIDYFPPEALAKDRQSFFDSVTQIRNIWNGDCLRLINYRASPKDNSELKHLHLSLGPIKWKDYVTTNQRLSDPELKILRKENLQIENFIDHQRLTDEYDVEASRLSNILTIYLTATTSDGFLIYSERLGNVGAHRKMKMCAVSENLHPYKDGFYGPETEAALFKAAARGLKEELSPDLVPDNPLEDLLLLGLEFHLDACHPGLLFYAPLRQSRREVEQRYRGGDSHEGRCEFVHLDNSNKITSILAEHDWFEGGKASLIRTLEYLRGKYNNDTLAVATALASAKTIE